MTGFSLFWNEPKNLLKVARPVNARAAWLRGIFLINPAQALA